MFFLRYCTSLFYTKCYDDAVHLSAVRCFSPHCFDNSQVYGINLAQHYQIAKIIIFLINE